jgi:hypothetical protein
MNVAPGYLIQDDPRKGQYSMNRHVMLEVETTGRAAPLSCIRCGEQMVEILRIEPLWSDPGLVAYECPDCGYVASELAHPAQSDQGP